MNVYQNSHVKGRSSSRCRRNRRRRRRRCDRQPLPPLPPLPPGWKATKDPLGQMYYYNRSTGAVQYELPGSRQNRRRRRRTATTGRRKEGRQETMIRLQAVAQFSTGDKKAELMGELAVLKNRERKRARRS